MARWYKLQIVDPPIKWKRGCIDRVLHVWEGKRPPQEEAQAREMAKVLMLLFQDELMRRLIAKQQPKGHTAATADNKNLSKQRRRGKLPPRYPHST